MSFVTAFIGELRERRLWPLVGVLIAGIVAVPMVLAKGASTTSNPGVPPSGVPVSSNSGSPSVSLASSPPATAPHGLGRDPFTQPFGTVPAPSSTGSVSASNSLPARPSLSTGGGGGAGATPSTGGGLGPASTPTTTTTPTTGGGTPTTTGANDPVDHPSKRAGGLTATEAYRVTLAINSSGGGLDTISPLVRLSVLPSQAHPLLVELGVLDGGHRVLFAVQPGAAVKGSGRCTPGPIDCQILSLAQGQTETLSSTDGSVSHVLLAVTAVKAARYPSLAAARRARRQASASGRNLLRGSTLSALALFQYNPARGAVVDLRNLGVGGH